MEQRQQITRTENAELPGARDIFLQVLPKAQLNRRPAYTPITLTRRCDYPDLIPPARDALPFVMMAAPSTLADGINV